MSTPSSPIPSSSHSTTISSQALAAAAERRTREATPQLTTAQLTAEHERRQKFRRLVDPGITRPNPKEQAMSSLKTLLTIADNLLREPDNEKFQQFKPTNSTIKRELVDRKGALEFAIELGFRPEVKNFQPYYTFHHRHLNDLKIGASILREYITLETEKDERIILARKNEKAAHDAAAEKVKLAFMDDRKSKLLKDQIEREQRTARAEAMAKLAAAEAEKAALESTQVFDTVAMPGAGLNLRGRSDILEGEEAIDEEDESSDPDHVADRKNR